MAVCALVACRQPAAAPTPGDPAGGASDPLCTASLSWVGAPAPATGGGRLLRVVPGVCPEWTAGAHVPWITFDIGSSSGTFGRGSGSLTVRAAPNPGPRRVGTATVAWTLLTIDQAGGNGSGCTFEATPAERTFTGGTGSSGMFQVVASADDCGWSVTRPALLEDTVQLSGGGWGDADRRFGLGPATIEYNVSAEGPTSPWFTAPLEVRDSALDVAARHLVKLTPP